MLTLLFFAIYIFSPFLCLHYFGARKALSIGFGIIMITIVLALGFGLGVGLLTATDSNYVRGMNLPHFWTNSYADASDSILELMAVPYVFFIDMYRIYFYVLFTNFKIVLWAPVLVTWFIVFTEAHRSGMFESSPAKQKAAAPQEVDRWCLTRNKDFGKPLN
jgi:hypothetical protein